jgi:hypothetical protein
LLQESPLVPRLTHLPAGLQKLPAVQSASIAQLVLQPVVTSHAYAPHDTGVPAGQAVAVVPGQLCDGVCPASLQVAAWQTAVELRQAPAPSHTLVLPHGEVAPQRVSVAPAASGAQLPAPFRLQAAQAAQLALPQQTASTQLPLMHSPPPAQAAPFGLSAQLFVVVFVPWQVNGARQSASVVHADLQLFVPQT